MIIGRFKDKPVNMIMTMVLYRLFNNNQITIGISKVNLKPIIPNNNPLNSGFSFSRLQYKANSMIKLTAMMGCPLSNANQVPLKAARAIAI